MACGESQKQLLSLIRNYASEKSQEGKVVAPQCFWSDKHGPIAILNTYFFYLELRVSDLKKKLLDLQKHLDAANTDLDGAKRSREVAEQELRGSQVQMSMIGASIQALEARIALLRDEVLMFHSNLDALKILNFSFADLSLMLQLHELLNLQTGKRTSGPQEILDPQGILKLKDLEDKTTCLSAQMQELEAEYLNEQCRRDKDREELAHIERRWFLVTAIMEETKQLQELAGYPLSDLCMSKSNTCILAYTFGRVRCL
ncbi:tropomyosin [Canna indica]|uniref:Tropomyosin n=1 Tax=Canna indica TaxID=4628 RepID=A0AAQ3JN53_9LILI|nr:tropomyosin [Canna indica]